MNAIRMREVFVAGGLPHHTYVARQEYRLEERLRRAEDNLCKLVTVTGATKSGKSVLTQKVFPPGKVVWIDSGSVRSEDDVWAEINRQLGIFTSHTTSETSGSQSTITAEAKAQLKLPFLASATGGVSPSYGTDRSQSTAGHRDDSPKSAAINALCESRRPLVIDDFHYLTREQQGGIVRALKAPIFRGCPVVALAIPHRRYDATRVEAEMNGRTEQIVIPSWQRQELERIAELGFSLLNIGVPKKIAQKLAEEALESPHLMQEFCRALCEMNSIEETLQDRAEFVDSMDLSPLFAQVAQSTSKVVFDRLAKGPRQRSDRTTRKFVDGSSGDIYVAVLRAIALCKPSMASIEYEEIRAKLRDILRDTPPDAQQVSRVIDKMAEISATDGASTPVLDWDREQRRLHITDPFFAFFLKWGLHT